MANLQSEIGILYLSEFNRQVIGKLLREKHLEFHPLFRSGLQVFISRDNPLAGRDRVTMKDLEPYPFIQFEQGEEGSFFFAEEAVWPENSPKQINVTDGGHDPQLHHRSERLHGVHRHRQRRPQQREEVVTVPLDSDETMTVGWISNERARLSAAAETYLDRLREVIAKHGYEPIG